VLASLVTASPELLVAQTGLLRELTEAGVVAGIHCEGPFLSAVRCGAQDPRYLLDPDPGLIRRLLAVADGTLRVMTIAPEKPGSAEIARLLADGGVTVALGHSDASYSGFAAAIRPAGLASLVTHLANGMPPLHHRAPGPVAAALVAAARHDITVELIADGVHAAAGFAGLVFAAAPGRVAIVSDAMAAAGMPDGGYQLGLQQVSVSDGVARVAGGALAGGTSHVLGEVRWLVRACGVTLASAVRAASATPAAAVGLADVGDLRAGLCADVLVVDDELRLLRVMRHGRWLL
jgi:N-acetylglucosamine-6-phosphate deacetylase